MLKKNSINSIQELNKIAKDQIYTQVYNKLDNLKQASIC